MTIAKLKRTSLGLALSAALAITFLVTDTEASDAHPRTSSLVGAWRMTQLEVGTPGDLQPVPYSGQIVVTKAGTVSVQARDPDATAPDTDYTLNGYEAFYGTYSIDRRGHTIAMTVESSVVPDLVGQRLTRVVTVKRDELVLQPTDPAEGFRVTYERV